MPRRGPVIRLLALAPAVAAIVATASGGQAPATGRQVSGTWPLAPHLSAAYDGRLGALLDARRNPHQRVHLVARLSGTIDGEAVAGSFVDSGVHYLFDPELAFDGRGQLTVGRCSGTAELRVTTAPLDYVLRWRPTSGASEASSPARACRPLLRPSKPRP